MATYLGLDVGTSSVKALLIDGAQRVIAVGNAPLEVSRPHPLWSEQDPEDWWQGTLAAIAAARAAASEADWKALAGIGLSGQMHGATLLDGAGRVLRPAILWNDGRSGAECAEMHRLLPDLTARAGNIAMPGFTAPKLLWVKHHEPEVFEATRTVLLPKDYVRFRLTGAKVSEMSDASGTLWLNVARRECGQPVADDHRAEQRQHARPGGGLAGVGGAVEGDREPARRAARAGGGRRRRQRGLGGGHRRGPPRRGFFVRLARRAWCSR